MEAVGDAGVRLTSWLSARQFLGNFFNKIAYRRLCFEMTDDKLKQLDKFRRNTTGKQYGLNLGKILTNTSEIDSQSKQHEIKDDR